MDKRYVTLDGLRGVAALMVVCFHWSLKQPLHMQHAYLAVDLFFVLSGFVIASAYENRLISGLTVRRFMALRIVRLYPLYFAALIPSIAVLAVSFIHHGALVAVEARTAGAVPFALLMLPFRNNTGWLYPLDPPAWSLLFELIANVVYGFTARFWTPRKLAIFIALMGAGLVLRSILTGGQGPGGGANWPELGDGLLRVGYSFPVGVLLFQVRNRLPQIQIPPEALLMALVAVIVLSAGWLQLVLVLVGFPVLVALGTKVEPRGLTHWCCLTAGTASYAIYILHGPIHGFVATVLPYLHVRPSEHVFDTALLPIVAISCLVLTRCYDAPARNLLSLGLNRVKLSHKITPATSSSVLHERSSEG